jgi:hypothetical protein
VRHLRGENLPRIVVECSFHGIEIFRSIVNKYDCADGSSGSRLVTDIRPLGNYKNGYLEVFKDHQGPSVSFTQFECLNDGYDQKAWYAARKASAEKMNEVLPDCERWWELNSPAMINPVIQINEQQPSDSVIEVATCNTTDSQEPCAVFWMETKAYLG